MLTGCSGAFTIDKTQIAVFNTWANDLTEAKRSLYQTNWLKLSGYLHGSFGKDLADLPVKTGQIISEIDIIMKQRVISDYDVWYTCGLAQKGASPIITAWVQKAIPYFGSDLVSLVKLLGWV
jgi:hypothetical protein